MAIPFLDIGLRLIDKLIPDPAAKAEHKLKLVEMQQQGEFKELDAELQLALAQIDVNKAEAESPSLFKGGWRPATGWVCVIGLFYQFIGQPILSWASGIYAFEAPPTLDTADLMTLLLGMLGLGAYRSYERINGAIPKGR